MFCQRRGPLSREHVIPEWITHHLGSGQVTHALTRGATTTRTWATDALSLTVKRVCKKCNTGWMEREVEAPAQTLMPALIRGEPKVMDPDEQRVLARWAAKTAVMFQYVVTPPRPVPAGRRRALYTRFEPSGDTLVFLAARLPEAATFARHHAYQLRPPDPTLGLEDAELVTFGIGHLVLQVFVFRFAEHTTFQPTGNVRGGTIDVRIWPLSGVTLIWPPQVIITTDDLLDRYASRFHT